MRLEVNLLLSVSRFTDHFYPLINNLTGRDAIYGNPGTSLRSFALSGTNPLQEFVDVPEEVVECYHACLDFCTDRTVILKVMSALSMQPYDIIEKILLISKNAEVTNPMMGRLKILNDNVQDAWEKLTACAIVDQNGKIDGIFTDEGSEFKQSLYDLKFYASDLVEALEKLEGMG